MTFKKSQFNKKPKANKFALENFVKNKGVKVPPELL